MHKFSGALEIQDVKHGESKYSVITTLLRGLKNFLLDVGVLEEDRIIARRVGARTLRARDWWNSLDDGQRQEHIKKSQIRETSIIYLQEDLRDALDDLIRNGNTLKDVASLCDTDVPTLVKSLDYFGIKRAYDYWEELKTRLVEEYAYAILSGEKTIRDVFSELRQKTEWGLISYSAVNNWFNEWVENNGYREQWERIKSPVLNESHLNEIINLARN